MLISLQRSRVSDPETVFTVTNSLPSDRISANFTLRELCKSEIATRRGINNWFQLDTQIQSAVFLARNVLQPLRDRFGPFTPNSVFRSQELERALKKKPKRWNSISQHTFGEAADIEIPGLPTLKLAEWCRDNLLFDQIILEMYEPDEPSSGWVHISRTNRRVNRVQLLSYIPDDNGKYIYVPGFRVNASM